MKALARLTNPNPLSPTCSPRRRFSLQGSLNPQPPSEGPIVVVGSANADIYVEIDRLPLAGETIAARDGFSLAGGKGANQACCAALLAEGERGAHFVGRIGDDANGKMLESALRDSAGVHLDRLRRAEAGVPSGHAVVMLCPNGDNSIVIVGGANMNGWTPESVSADCELVRKAGVVLLQREIPDWVNIEVAKAARSAGVTVVLDAGGMDAPFPGELLRLVNIFSPNETELARLTGMPTDTFEQICEAVVECHKMGVGQVLVKLGGQGSALFVEGEKPIRQPIVPAVKVVDTTGAGDTFTAAFAVALVEGKSRKERLKFAAAAASLCVQVKGAIPSMPSRESVNKLLQSLVAENNSFT